MSDNISLYCKTCGGAYSMLAGLFRVEPTNFCRCSPSWPTFPTKVRPMMEDKSKVTPLMEEDKKPTWDKNLPKDPESECRPLVALTESDVRRIVREEFSELTKHLNLNRMLQIGKP